MSPERVLRVRPEIEKPTLLTIPAELRNRVYHMVLFKGSPISPWLFDDREEELESLQLLQACRQIRSEAQRIYYGTNKFRFYDERSLKSTLAGMFIALGPLTLQLCKSVSLEGTVEYTCDGSRTSIWHDCPDWDCCASVEIDFTDRTVSAASSTNCCGRDIDTTDFACSLRRIIDSVDFDRADGETMRALALALVQSLFEYFTVYNIDY